MRRNKFVIDTNVLLVSIASHSQYHWLFKALIARKYEICISNDILMEYEEIISSKYSETVAKNITRTLLLLPNCCKTDIYYFWNLLKDKDDNKFVDAAISCGASGIVTHDRHFDALKEIEFPKLLVLKISEFEEVLITHDDTQIS